jgi:hypothetical protein
MVTTYTIQVTRKGATYGDFNVGWTTWTSAPAGPHYVSSGAAPHLFAEDASATPAYFPTPAGSETEKSPLGHSDTANPASSTVSMANETTWGALPVSI